MSTGSVLLIRVSVTRIVRKPVAQLAKDLRGLRISRLDQAIVRPLAVTAGSDESGPPQVSQVTRDLRLVGFQSFDESANANFAVAQEINQAQSRGIREGLEE